MKKTAKFLCLWAFSCLLLSACNDNEAPTPEPEPANPKAQLLSAKKWRMTANTQTTKLGSTEVTVSLFDLYPDCAKDNLEVFAPNKTYSIEAGTTKCDPSEPQSAIEGTWDLIENDTKLKTTYTDGSFITVSIKELTANTLKFQEIETTTYPNGTVETITTDSVYQGQ